MWKLNRVILHIVYGEWLSLKDLSKLDITCLGNKDREAWLSSLCDLRVQSFDWIMSDMTSEENMKIFYLWVGNRKVFCEDEFPVRISLLKDLMEGIDLTSFCRSIYIHSKNLPKYTELESNLSVFLSHCHGLQAVRVYSDRILQVLNKKLADNSLIKVDVEVSDESHKLVRHLLKKHASSLQELRLVVSGCMDLIVSTLVDNHIRVKALDVCIVDELVEESIDDWLVPILSSTGDLLETLEICCCTGYYFDIDPIVVSAAESCPKLTHLEISDDVPCSMKSLCHLFEKCPCLQHVSIGDMIKIDHKESSITVEVEDSQEYWAKCLSYALARRQYKKVTLRLNGTRYSPVENLKSILEPYQIHLAASSSKSSLIDLLNDLPHVNNLNLQNFNCSDVMLRAIIQHAKFLTEMHIQLLIIPSQQSDPTRSSDKEMGELIESCQQLRRFSISGCGMESLVAVSKHSNLKYVFLTVSKSVTEEMLDELLLDEKVVWPLTLENGTVRLKKKGAVPSYHMASFNRYGFNSRSQRWTVVR